MRKGKPVRKYSQAGRVHDLIRFIEARHGVSVDEMAEESGVERRTIYRDLSAIQEAGYPLVSEWLNGSKVYRFLTHFKNVPPINFTLQELMTLYFLRSPCDFLQGTPFQEEIDSIFRKVNTSLPPRYAAHMERIATVSIPLLQGKRDYGKVAEPLKLLREALLYQYRVKLAYRAKGKGKASAYRVDPYSLIFFKGGLYLLGFAHNRQGMRTFAAERISRVEVERERFEIPEDFRPERQFRSAFGIVEEAVMQVRIKFSPVIAHTVRDRLWHPSQKTVSMPDGSIVLSFEAGGRMEIASWILSYGEHAEVLAPAELREEIGRKVGEMAARYAC
jgi:proteasome accessory factor B